MNRYSFNLQREDTQQESDQDSFSVKWIEFIKKQNSTSKNNSLLRGGLNYNEKNLTKKTINNKSQKELLQNLYTFSSRADYVKNFLCRLLETSARPVSNLHQKWKQYCKSRSRGEFLKVDGFLQVFCDFFKSSDYNYFINNKKFIEKSCSNLFYEIIHEKSSDISFNMFLDYVLHLGKTRKKKCRNYQEECVFNFENSDLTKKIYYFDDFHRLVALLKNKSICILNSDDYKLEHLYTNEKENYQYLTCEFITAPFNNLVLSNSGMEVKFFEYTNKNKLKLAYQKNFYSIGSITCLLYNKFHKCFFSGSRSGIISIWRPTQVGTAQHQSRFDTSEKIGKLSFVKHSQNIFDMVNNDKNSNIITCGDNKIIMHQLKNDSLVSGVHEKGSSLHRHGIFSICYNELQDFCCSSGNESFACVHIGPLRMGNLRKSNSFKLIDDRQPGYHPIMKVATYGNEIFTFDNSGLIKVWDIRKFECVQNIQSEVVVGSEIDFLTKNNKLNHVAVQKKESKIITCGSRIKLFKLNTSKKPNQAVDQEIVNVFFDVIYGFIICTSSSVVFYSLEGIKCNEIKKICHSQITSCCYDDKKFFFGTSDGEILCYSVAGKFFTSFKKKNFKEVTSIFQNNFQQMISTYWGGLVVVLSISFKRENKAMEEVFSSTQLNKTKPKHSSDIIASDEYHNKSKSFFITVSSNEILLWLQKDRRNVSPIAKNDIKGIIEVTFLDQNFIACSDEFGLIYIYQLRFPFKLIKKFQNYNEFTLYMSPITRMCFDKKNKLLFCGDNSGGVCIFDLNEILKTKDEKTEIKVKKHWKAHQDVVAIMKFISYEDKTWLLTSSRYSVALWDLEGRKIGELKQKQLKSRFLFK